MPVPCSSPSVEVVFLFPRWEVSGVTTVNLDLSAVLRDRGANCRLVVEHDNRADCPYELPKGIPCFNLSESSPGWERFILSRRAAYRIRTKRAQRQLRGILAEPGRPVVLIPGYAQSLATPRRPWGKDVGVLGVVQSDDDANLDFAVRHGKDWIRCVCVSQRLAQRVSALAPWLEPVVIPNGVPCTPQPPAVRNRKAGDAMKVVYAGRFDQRQKRILDLATLIDVTCHLSIQWEVAGEGPEEKALLERLAPHIHSRRVRWHGKLKRADVRRLFRESDLVVMFSTYEGMPLSLLEAMAEGCASVISEGCDAGGDLVRTSGAGHVLPTGDLEKFAAALKALSETPDQLAILGNRAWSAIANGPYNAAAMGEAYDSFIRNWMESHCADNHAFSGTGRV